MSSLHSSSSIDVGALHESSASAPSAGTGSLGSGGILAIAGFASALLFWGGNYLSHYGGRFDANEYSYIPAPRVSGSTAPADPNAVLKSKGKLIFNSICANCHNEDGAGKPGIAPKLNGSDWVNAPGSARLIRIVLHGLQGPVKVTGEVFNVPGQAMGPQSDVVKTDDDVAAVLTYVRSAWENKAAPVTPDEVKQIREAEKARTTNWTAEELEKIPMSGGSAGTTELTPDQLRAKLKALPADQLKTLLQDLGK